MQRWSVLLGCFIGMSVSLGPIFFQSLGLYLKPMTDEFGWSRTEFAAVFSIAGFASMFGLSIAGYLVDRFGPPRIIVLGFTLLCASYASFSLVNSYTAFVAIAFLVAITGSLATYPSYQGLLPRWFDKNLGLSLAIASSGIGVGTALFPYIINAGLQSGGWRYTFVLVAGVTFSAALVNFLLFIRQNKGPLPRQEERATGPDAGLPDVSFKQALRTSDFWILAASFSLIFLVAIGLNFHLAALVTDRGGSPTQAASVLAIAGGASLTARLITGPLLDRFPVKFVGLVFFSGQAIGCVLLLQGHPTLTIVAAILLGAAQGAELDMMPFVVARRFGKIAYSQIYGTLYGVLQIGTIVSPMILATIFDRTGSYAFGLTIYPILSVLGLGLLWAARTSAPVDIRIRAVAT